MAQMFHIKDFRVFCVFRGRKNISVSFVYIRGQKVFVFRPSYFVFRPLTNCEAALNPLPTSFVLPNSRC